MPGILGKVLAIVVSSSAMGLAQIAPSTQPTTRPIATHPIGMVWVPGGEFEMGALPTDTHARADESPRHRVKVDGFWMDATEVTNAQFAAFVKATGYVTTAEKPVDWEAMKKTVPEGTPKPPEEALQPGGLCFHCAEVASTRDPAQWWNWTHGADWKHPAGPGSSIEGKDNLPVVLVSWDDCVAYCKWAGKRLPTEAEWEHAARAGNDDTLYPWGDEDPEQGKPKANTWQGKFPAEDTGWDGFKGIAPVKSFAPSSLGLYDLAGNVWEWTADNYRPDTYAIDAKASAVTINPPGPKDSYDPDEPTIPKRTMRGGSFLCHESYCSSYRISARMKSSPDTGLSHTGFRCVKDGEK